MIINPTYFAGDLTIPQLSQPAVQNTLSWFINEYEPKFLNDLLGYQLYSDYTAGITGATPAAIWTELRDGKEYTNKFGRLDKWKGLSFTLNGVKKSPIANYIYYWYLRNEATTTTGGGEVASNVAMPASPAGKMTRAWNQMVDWNRELVEFMNGNANYNFDPNRFFTYNAMWYYSSNSNTLRDLVEKINLIGF